MLTEREKKLMRMAYETGFLEGVLDAENGHSNYTVVERFEDWLSDDVAEGGYTVEMLLSHEAGT